MKSWLIRKMPIFESEQNFENFPCRNISKPWAVIMQALKFP